MSVVSSLLVLTDSMQGPKKKRTRRNPARPGERVVVRVVHLSSEPPSCGCRFRDGNWPTVTVLARIGVRRVILSRTILAALPQLRRSGTSEAKIAGRVGLEKDVQCTQ